MSFDQVDCIEADVSSKPLGGIRVLDLTRLLPGPLCAQHLADLGADVIKIEDVDRGDYVRPSLRRLANRNKRGIRLDLKKREGADVLRRLLDRADVLIESFRPGVMERLGFGYDAVRTINKRVVYGSITGYGQTGPYARLPGHDINYLAYAGILDGAGSADGPPALSNFLLADLLGGTLTAAMGILAAVVDAGRTGMGRHVDVAMMDAAFTHNVLALADVYDHGRAKPRGSGSHTGGKVRYGIYRTADRRYLAVGAQERPFWERLCTLLGREDLKALHDDDRGPSSIAARALEDIFASQTLEHWADKLAGEDVCVSPLLRVEEAIGDPQVLARALTIESEEGLQIGLPLKMSRFEFSVDRPPPAPGEHSTEVLAELGYSQAEVAHLRACRAV